MASEREFEKERVVHWIGQEDEELYVDWIFKRVFVLDCIEGINLMKRKKIGILINSCGFQLKYRNVPTKIVKNPVVLNPMAAFSLCVSSSKYLILFEADFDQLKSFVVVKSKMQFKGKAT